MWHHLVWLFCGRRIEVEATKKAYLEALGVNLEITLPRFLDNEEFYLRMLGKFVDEPYVRDIEIGLENEDYEAAFRACHSLKGVSVNLGLDRLYERTLPLTEALREPPHNLEEIRAHFEKVKESYLVNIEGIKKALA